MAKPNHASEALVDLPDKEEISRQQCIPLQATDKPGRGTESEPV